MGDILVEIAGALGPLRTLGVLQQKLPTSLKVTLNLLRDARQSASLKICLQREFAATVDKDRHPRWRPAFLAAVTPEILAPYFAPFGNIIF